MLFRDCHLSYPCFCYNVVLWFGLPPFPPTPTPDRVLSRFDCILQERNSQWSLIKQSIIFLSANIASSDLFPALFTLIAVGSFGAKYQEYFSTRDYATWGENLGELHWAWGVGLTGMLINVIALLCLVTEIVAGTQDAYWTLVQNYFPSKAQTSRM